VIERPAADGREPPSIWWFAFGYFATYVPYSALTNALSRGSLEGMDEGIAGTTLLPSSVIASAVGMLVFLTVMRWWKYATQRVVFGVQVPSPRLRTLLSGACTSVIVVTTTLAYTFEGISIVLAMLLMRGGLLILAPVVDLVSRRKVKWYSFAALLLSLAALIVAFLEKKGFNISLAAGVDIAMYLTAYFVRLRIMSGSAKSKDNNENKRYFVEEQMVATPLIVLVLGLWAAFGSGLPAAQLRTGFTDIWSSDVLVFVLLVGLFSQGTGVFGGLILLDKRENTFCVPVNRASSIMAGLVATLAMYLIWKTRLPTNWELAGAVLIVLAIVVLSVPPLLERKRPVSAP
jgi:hypothetical protein